MNEEKLFSYAVYNALGVGPENARTRKELCAAVGCSDRNLRLAIEVLRHDYPILTDDDGKGYYLPTSDDRGRKQAVSWLRRQESRRESIRQAMRGARRFVMSTGLSCCPAPHIQEARKGEPAADRRGWSGTEKAEVQSEGF